jgi:hypothetical protein
MKSLTVCCETWYMVTRHQFLIDGTIGGRLRSRSQFAIEKHMKHQFNYRSGELGGKSTRISLGNKDAQPAGRVQRCRTGAVMVPCPLGSPQISPRPERAFRCCSRLFGPRYRKGFNSPPDFFVHYMYQATGGLSQLPGFHYAGNPFNFS